MSATCGAKNHPIPNLGGLKSCAFLGPVKAGRHDLVIYDKSIQTSITQEMIIIIVYTVMMERKKMCS